ncbi:hypothetical protein MRB53_012400 [Persea americana]|uniref:Uncharacterized protein n=1 Tax=Persea americana TaxID=3435 RepID=A0ACC2LY46_PERAE|nr:hypothetical protein MRB53_012400 [Persea americana]
MYEGEPPMSPTRPSSASMVSFAPSSPESTWAFSPPHHHNPNPTSPSPTLLYYCLASLHRHDGSVLSIAISKGAVFTGSDSKRIRVWRQSECVERGHIKVKSGHVNAILAYGNTLFTAHKDHKVRVWAFSATDHFRSKKLATLPKKAALLSFPRANGQQQHKDTITCIAYYNPEGLLYTGSRDKTVKVWRLTNRKCVDSFVAHEDRVNAIVVNQEDGCVFTCSSDGSIKIWRRVYGESSHTLTMTLRFQPSPANALAVSSCHKSCYLYSGSSDGFINFWEKEDGSGRYNHGGFLQGHRFAVLCLTTLDRVVFSGSEDMTIRVWKREEGSSFHVCLAVLEGHRGPVKCLAACMEMDKVVIGFLVYSASTDRTVKVWSIKMFPGGEKKVSVVEDDDEVDIKKKMEYEMSPVLSPLWVEKKRQAIT